MDWKPIDTVPRDGNAAFLAWFHPGFVAHVYLTAPEPPLVQTYRFFGGPLQGQQAGWPKYWMPLSQPQDR